MFFICDKYFSVIYYNTGDEANRDLNPSQYKKLLCDITTWGDFNHDVQDQITRLGTEIPTKPIVGSFFLDLMFEMTDISKSGFVSFSNVIQTVDKIVSSDFATLVGIFFDLHDRGKLGSLNKEEMIQTSESLLFILRNEVNDSYLSSISGLISRAFQLKSTTEPWSISRNLFKELIEGDDFLKSYFTTGFKSSFVRADVETKQIIEPVKPVSTKDVMHAVENGVKWGVKWAEGINNSRNKTIVVDAAMGITTSVPSAGVDAELDVFEDSHEDMMNEVEELLKNAELLDTEGINLDSPLASPGIQSAPNAF